MVALSTRYAHRLAPDEARNVLFQSEAGALVLDRDLPPEVYQEILSWDAPVLALEAPCPRTRASLAMLCSPDRDEARTALEAAFDTVRQAGKLGARFVGVWLGEVRAMEAEWRLARERFLRGDLGERLVQRLLVQRRAVGERNLDVARRALDRLARAAESEGVTLVVANGRRFIAVPDPRELDLLLNELRGAPLQPLFDVPAAHLPDVMGFYPFALTQAAFGAAPLCYLGDACGPIGGLPPGRGQLDLSKIEVKGELVFSPWSGLRVEETKVALTSLARLRS